jgi:hypothetical protein
MKLTSADFAESFGELEGELHESVKSLIEESQMSLSPITDHERDLLLIEIIERIRADKQVIGAQDRTAAWERGWAENLELFRQDTSSDAALVPRFVRPGLPIRWFKQYYNSNLSNFELGYINILRQHVITKYFTDTDFLYEFGAGTGFNLLHAHKVFPQMNLIGTDFVQPAVELMNEVGAKRKIPLKASLFNMLTPGLEEMILEPNSAVWTFGSIEQLGGQVDPIIKYLISSKVKVCVHIEPVVEFYDEESLEDYLAKWFQSKRGYSEGLVKLLFRYQAEGKIEILKSQRLNFGSLMMEGYNLLVWRPKV